MNLRFNQKLSSKVLEIILSMCIFIFVSLILVMVINPQEIFARTRDTKRLDDFSKIVSALDHYRERNNWQYPDNLSLLSDFLSPLPTDPLTQKLYGYIANDSRTEYELDTILESERYQHYRQEDQGDNPALYEVGNNLKLIEIGLFDSSGQNPPPQPFSLISPPDKKVITGQQKDSSCSFPLHLQWEKAKDPGDQIIYYYYLDNNPSLTSPEIVGNVAGNDYEVEYVFDDRNCTDINQEISWTVIAKDSGENTTQAQVWRLQLIGQ